MWCENVVLYNSFTCNCLVFPAMFAEKDAFFPLYIFAFIVLDSLTTYIWIYFGAFCSVSLSCVSVFVL